MLLTSPHETNKQSARNNCYAFQRYDLRIIRVQCTTYGSGERSSQKHGRCRKSFSPELKHLKIRDLQPFKIVFRDPLGIQECGFGGGIISWCDSRNSMVKSNDLLSKCLNFVIYRHLLSCSDWSSCEVWYCIPEKIQNIFHSTQSLSIGANKKFRKID